MKPYVTKPLPKKVLVIDEDLSKASREHVLRQLDVMLRNLDAHIAKHKQKARGPGAFPHKAGCQ